MMNRIQTKRIFRRRKETENRRQHYLVTKHEGYEDLDQLGKNMRLGLWGLFSKHKKKQKTQASHGSRPDEPDIIVLLHTGLIWWMWAIDPRSLCFTECDYFKLIRLWPHFTEWYYRAHMTPGCTPTQNERSSNTPVCVCRHISPPPPRYAALFIDGWPPLRRGERDSMAHIAAA